mmetsp:Transcript_30119/g.82317  ORF Transcript_30119/g.82317 Transcript_30119/m.82317 type:complete len:159 (+) Transcript_30119:115-591(+)|eukprot:scaffold50049_cov31-Tisochrysis_lutea.AAC.6
MRTLTAQHQSSPPAKRALVAVETTSRRLTRSKSARLVSPPAEPSRLWRMLIEAETAPEEDASDMLFEAPAHDDEPDEEYDEGDVVDDERPPFADAEPEAADPALVAQIDAAVEEEEEGEYMPIEEPEPEEEYEEGNVIAEDEEEDDEEDEDEEDDDEE